MNAWEVRYRILVTGSRDWISRGVVWTQLGIVCDAAPKGREIVIIHGGARGVDQWTEEWAKGFRVLTEVYPAQWMLEGRGAGLIRSKRMVDKGADVCLAFIRDGSRGATHCAKLAEAAGIETRRFVETTLQPPPPRRPPVVGL